MRMRRRRVGKRKMHQSGNPQNPGGASLATTSITPLPILPPFKFLKALFPRFQVAALSMAIMNILLPVATLVSSQHEPQLGEFHVTPGAPPIKGKVGTSLNVGYLVTRPFGPFEHETLLSEPLGLS